MSGRARTAGPGSRPSLAAGALASLLLVAPLAAGAAEPLAVDHLEFIGSAAIPPGTTFDGAEIGGLSGISWDAESGLFWAISDDRSEHAPARIVKLAVDISDGRLEPEGAAVAGVVFLRREDGSFYPRRSIDAEGIAMDGGSVWVSSEGEGRSGLPPFVGEFSRDGRLRRYLPLPYRFVPDRPGHGIRDNLAFEALSLSPDRRTLWVGTEGALQQDGPASDFGVASRSRIRRIDLTGRSPEREVLYTVEPVSNQPHDSRSFRLRGLVDLLALDDDHFLALEREYVERGRNVIQLFLVETAGATDVSSLDPPGPDAVPVSKRLVLDLAATGQTVENVEGISFGPPLRDGRRTLLLVADDNFYPTSCGSQLFAFAVGARPPSPVPSAGRRRP